MTTRALKPCLQLFGGWRAGASDTAFVGHYLHGALTVLGTHRGAIVFLERV